MINPMAQTRFLRSVIRLTWRERLTAFLRGRLAVSATVRPGALDDIKIGPFQGNENDAEHWMKTGQRKFNPPLIPGVRGPNE